MSLWLRTLLLVIVVPGAVVGWIPWLLARDRVSEPPAVHWLGLLLLVVGWVGILYCVRDFVRRGRGTPAPYDAPRELVATGLYTLVRNPMYLSALLVILGQAIWFWSRAVTWYALFIALAYHLFVVLYEEPTLARRFGASYAAYRERVPRWLPSWHGDRKRPAADKRA
jgi:protein-S-isoprenylcysteine O-methyltransferase Ste14